MNTITDHILVVGGGTAGWLTAAVVAAAHRKSHKHPLTISLIESPNIPTIGVGEGSWPTLRATLKNIGLDEVAFMQACSVSLKQGTEFVGWRCDGHRYVHPFSHIESELAVGDYWSEYAQGGEFAPHFNVQAALATLGIAPKQANTPPYSFAMNYGYHLDAGAFAKVLAKHSVEELGVNHIIADVVDVAVNNGEISELILDNGQTLSADLFVDCTGSAGILITKALGVPDVDLSKYSLNNRAIAIQAPYADDNQDIKSLTQAVAHDDGWIWDIALESRRGTGIVYSESYLSDEAAEQRLRSYLKRTGANDVDALNAKVLSFRPHHKERFWQGNCLAVGMSAGFIEPLEATAIVLIEESASFLANNLPLKKAALPAIGRTFNAKMQRHWSNIVEFLKLHYIASERQSAYWQAHQDSATWPDSLKDKLKLWESRSPSADDVPNNALFPSASYQYIKYGMGQAQESLNISPDNKQKVEGLLQEVAQRRGRFATLLPSNREFLTAIKNKKIELQK